MKNTDRYVHDQRIGQEIIFLTLTHRHECKDLTVGQIRTISEEIFHNLPYRKQTKLEQAPKSEYNDRNAETNEQHGGRDVCNAFLQAHE